MYLFLNGVIAAGCLVAAFFFLQMFRRTRDGLFVFFGLAFLILALERFVLSWMNTPEESTPAVYLLRLAAFLCILYAIVRKNLVRQ